MPAVGQQPPPRQPGRLVAEKAIASNRRAPGLRRQPKVAYSPDRSVPGAKPIHSGGTVKGKKHDVSLHQCAAYLYEHRAKAAPGSFTIETAQGQEIVLSVTEAIFGEDPLYIQSGPKGRSYRQGKFKFVNRWASRHMQGEDLTTNAVGAGGAQKTHKFPPLSPTAKRQLRSALKNKKSHSLMRAQGVVNAKRAKKNKRLIMSAKTVANIAHGDLHHYSPL